MHCSPLPRKMSLYILTSEVVSFPIAGHGVLVVQYELWTEGFAAWQLYLSIVQLSNANKSYSDDIKRLPNDTDYKYSIRLCPFTVLN